MNEQTNYPNWTDEQWRRVTDLVATEADKARVGARYLPLYGPVDPSVVAVPDYLLGNSPNPPYAPLRAPNRLDVDSSPNTYLATITIQIPLANHEVAEPELQAASVAFRRAAVTIARVEDALLFNGQPAPGIAPAPTFPGGWLANLPPIFSVNGGAQQGGLVPTGAMPNVPPPIANIAPRVDVPLPLPVGAPPPPWLPGVRQAYMAAWSEIIVRAISDTVALLEGNGHAGPFACFLSPDVFEAVHTPSPAMVLPRDRILPFLGGDYLCRSNTIPNGYGIVVAGVPAYETDAYGKRQKQSGGGGPVEIVVATDISLRYLQQTPEPKFLFRVWEKIALRVKEWDAVAVLRPL
jgi:Encapsulating protein for peroxidase